MTTRQDRSTSGNVFKAMFNHLWDLALKANREGGVEGLSYRDMVRIADAMRHEGPAALGLERLPRQIEAGLLFGMAAVNPNKASTIANIKSALALTTGAAGLTLVVLCLGTILNPSVWAIVAAFVVGGWTFGPLSILGVVAGLAMVGAAAYAGFRKMTPTQRAAHAHVCVTGGVDKWIEQGDSTVANVPSMSSEAPTS
jgi:hypothetical protein